MANRWALDHADPIGKTKFGALGFCVPVLRNTNKSGVTGQGMKEAQNINKSLSALGDVIQSLVVTLAAISAFMIFLVGRRDLGRLRRMCILLFFSEDASSLRGEEIREYFAICWITSLNLSFSNKGHWISVKH